MPVDDRAIKLQEKKDKSLKIYILKENVKETTKNRKKSV